MEEFHLYKDIKARTGGEIFLGVVGPVRTGKSTFVRHFMELLVLPNLKDNEKKIATDELPTSGKGKTITSALCRDDKQSGGTVGLLFQFGD